jgi:hypothetical protein
MGDVFTEGLAGDPAVRVVIITGGAPGYFDRHFDMQSLIKIAESLRASGREWPENATYNGGFFDQAMALCESMPKPAIAAISGTALAGARRAIAAAKGLVNQVSLLSTDRLLDAITSFGTALTWPETQQRVRALLEREDCNATSTLRNGGPRCSARSSRHDQNVAMRSLAKQINFAKSPQHTTVPEHAGSLIPCPLCPGQRQ